MSKPKTTTKISKRRFNDALRTVCAAALFYGASAAAMDSYYGQIHRIGSQRATVDPDNPCYRSGRCDAVYSDRTRLQRYDRLAPQAPEPIASPALPLRSGEITPVEHLMPPYRDAGSVREEFRQSGQAR